MLVWLRGSRGTGAALLLAVSVAFAVVAATVIIVEHRHLSRREEGAVVGLAREIANAFERDMSGTHQPQHIKRIK